MKFQIYSIAVCGSSAVFAQNNWTEQGKSSLAAGRAPSNGEQQPAVSGPDNRYLWTAYSMLEHLVPELNKGVAHDPNDPRLSRQVLFKHGCYCFPDRDGIARPRNGYHGPGVDELDNLCRDLYRAQKCLKEEEVYNGEECELIQDYAFWRKDDGTIECGKWSEKTKDSWKTRPENQCAYKNCLLEREFVYQVEALLKSGFDVENSPVKNLNDGPEYEAVCPTGANGGNNVRIEPENIACCGNDLNRRPYNNLVQKCCDGEVSSFGSC